MRARIRDTEIYFDVDGAGLVAEAGRMRERPTAFMIHGGPGVDHVGLRARYGSLAQRMQLVYFDHRGHGRSARDNPARYTLEDNVEDMEALRQHLGLGPIVSIGTSYGGRVAMLHAARYPHAVSHLILVAAAAHSGALSRAKQIVAARGTAEQIAMYEDMLAGRINSEERLASYLKVMGSLYSRKNESATGSALVDSILTPEAFNRAHGPGGFLHTVDLRSELGAITAQTLILAGRHDWRCAPEFSEEIHRLIPGSDLRIFEESGHTIASDEAQACLDAIAGFVVYKKARNKYEQL